MEQQLLPVRPQTACWPVGPSSLTFASAHALVSAGGRDSRNVRVWDVRREHGDLRDFGLLGGWPRRSADDAGSLRTLQPAHVVGRLPHVATVTAVAARGGLVVSGDTAGIVRLWRLPEVLRACPAWGGMRALKEAGQDRDV